MYLSNPESNLVCETAQKLNFWGIDYDGYNFTSIKPNIFVHVKPLKNNTDSQHINYIIQLQIGDFASDFIGPSKIVPEYYTDALVEARKFADEIEQILNDPVKTKIYPWNVILDLIKSPELYELQPKHPGKPLSNPFRYDDSQYVNPYDTGIAL